MTGKSNSFFQITPFIPKTGILGSSYIAFPLDVSSAPVQSPFGCIDVAPKTTFSSTGEEGGPFTPESRVYTITNIGGSTSDWELTIGETWITADILSGTLTPSQSVDVTLTLDADLLLTSDTPYTSTLIFENTTNGCGNISLSASVTVTGGLFDQYDGPFAGIRYLTESASGENRVIYSLAFLGVDHSHSAGAFPAAIPTAGVNRTVWGGSSTYNPMTGLYSGGINVTQTQSGIVPGGVNFLVSAAAPVSIVSDTVGGVASEFAAVGRSYNFASRSISTGVARDGTLVTRFFSNTPRPAVGGYFAGFSAAYIWADGYTLTVTSSNLQTPAGLGIPVARTGTAARTQHLLTYDSGTMTYTGTKSRAKQTIAIPAGKTKLYADYKFLVTPDDLSAPYIAYISREFTVTPSTNYLAIMDFPWIAAATVYYISGSFSFTPTYFLGFSDFPFDTEITSNSPVVSSWPEQITFGCPPKNADAWDDFDEYGLGNLQTSPLLARINTGYAWVDDAIFKSVDPVDAYDNFESYPTGVIANLTQGVGWALVGLTFITSNDDAYDDFESYTAGAITVLDFPSPFWFQVGGFV